MLSEKKNVVLLRVSALFFYFAFLLIKNSRGVFETGSVGLVESQPFFFSTPKHI